MHKFISFYFYEFTGKREAKIMLYIRLLFPYLMSWTIFIRNRVTAKSNYFKSLFGNEKHSKRFFFHWECSWCFVVPFSPWIEFLVCYLFFPGDTYNTHTYIYLITHLFVKDCYIGAPGKRTCFRRSTLGSRPVQFTAREELSSVLPRCRDDRKQAKRWHRCSCKSSFV